MNYKLLLFCVVLFSSCGAKVTSRLSDKKFPKFSAQEPVYILEMDDLIPENSTFIGDVKVGDSGFSTDCDYNNAIDNIKLKASNSGANIVQITQVKEPSSFLGSSCYRVKAKMYRNIDSPSLTAFNEKRSERNKSRLPDDSDYALIHFYRPNMLTGSALRYRIKDSNDSIVGRLSNGDKFIVKTKNFGPQRFYGTLETTEEINLNVEKGKEYFVRCAIKAGVIFGRPAIDIIENHKGIKEFEKIKD